MRAKYHPDLQSVRSVPILSAIQHKHTQSPSKISIYSPSEFESKLKSQALSKVLQPYWKDVIHPEVLEKYNQLLRQGQVAEAKKRSRLNESPIRKYQTSRIKDSTATTHLIERIKSLEQQNLNLREELYYLREALLLNFQNRDKSLH